MNDSAHNDQAKSAIALQQRFFAAPNRFIYEDDPRASSDQVMIELARSLLRHRSGHVDRPLLLPFRAHDADPITWFACAPEGAQARAMASELEGFLGPSFANFAPLERTADAADRHIDPVLRDAGWHSIRFEAIASTGDIRVLQQWTLYSQLMDRRPRAPTYVPQTFEQLRAAFDRALSARNEQAARALLGALHERFGLSAENRLYLEIRLAAALERWGDIARHPLLPTLVHLTLPRETYGDVMEALYQVDVCPAESARELDELLEAFRLSLATRAARLFRSRGTSNRVAVHKSFLLHELTQPNPDGLFAAQILTNLTIGAFGSLDAAVRARVASLVPLDSRQEAQQALKEEKFDRAYELFWPLNNDFDVLAALVLCAREAEDPAKAGAVLERLTAAPQPLPSMIRAELPHRVARLEELARRQRPPSTRWSDLLRQTRGETDEYFVERWRELARSSDPADVLREADIGQVAAQHLLDLAVVQPDVFEQLYPLWHELFVDRCPPDKRLVPVYEALIETLRLRDVFAAPELDLLQQTLTMLLRAGVSGKTYAKVVDEIGAVFAQVRSPQVLTWALSVCDTLAISPIGDAEARLRLLTVVAQACVDYGGRLDFMQRALLQLLATEAGLTPPALPADTSAMEEDVRPDDREGLVAFYSLDEAAARRASSLLTTLYPRIRVECSADLVCSPRLRKLAQTADVFVFAWKSSKHAAYDCVKAACPSKDVLVMAPGGGATSLLATAIQNLH
ncbi:protein DpdD [Dyella japonica]|uniref:DUF2325 domain-containing protein n=1 Tax=Dyella japonica TaxID=231455 RepID=A0ABV2JX24_9GAMM